MHRIGLAAENTDMCQHVVMWVKSTQIVGFTTEKRQSPPDIIDRK